MYTILLAVCDPLLCLSYPCDIALATKLLNCLSFLVPYKRPVAAVSWCPDGGSKIAIAYCNLEFQATHPDTTKESYVFNVGKFLSRKS